MLLCNLKNVWKVYYLHRTVNVYSDISKVICGIKTNNMRLFCSEPSYIVQVRGLDYDTKAKDLVDFFKPLGITPKAVHLKCDGSGRVSGVSEVEFSTHAEAVVAMRKRNAFIGNKFIRLTLKSSDMDASQPETPKANDDHKGHQQLTRNTISPEFNISPYVQGSLYHTGHIVKMKNVPRRITEQAIYDFFWPIGVAPISVKALYNESGIRTGEFEAQFLTKNHAARAMAKNNAYIGRKFIRLSLA